MTSSLGVRAARGAAWTAVAQWVQLGFSLAVFAWLSRLLTPAAFGLFALAMTGCMFSLILFGAVFREPLVQRSEITRDEASTLFWTSTGLGLLAAGLNIALAPWIASILGAAEAAPLVQSLSLKILCDAAASVPTAIRLRQFDFARMGRQQIWVSLISGAIAVVAASLGANVWALIVQQLALSVGTLAFHMASSGFRPRLVWHARSQHALTGFSARILCWQTLDFLNLQFDRALIGERLGIAVLGFYAAGRRVNELLIESSAGALATVVLPIFASIQGETTRLRDAYLRSIGLLGFFAFPASLGLVAIAPALVPLVLGPNWTQSVPIVQVFAVTGILRAVSTVQSTILRSLGRPGLWLAYLAIQTCANLAVLFFLTPYGIVATAIGMVARDYLLWPILFVIVQRLLGLSMRQHLQALLPSLVASLAMFVAILARQRLLPIGESNTLILAVDIALGAFIYLGVSFLLARRHTTRAMTELQRLVVRNSVNA